MNIIFDGHSLQFIGGMERVICDLSSAMAERGHNVFLFTKDSIETRPVFDLHPQINRRCYTHNGRQSHINQFRQQILSCNPHVCVSFAGDRRHVPWCAALIGTGIPLIVSEQCSPEAVENIFWNREERLAVMAAADAIHILNEPSVESIPLEFRSKTYVIPNAIDRQIHPSTIKKEDVIVALGRLEKDKQYDLLIAAFILIAKEFPSWKLEIWGDGSQKSKLQRAITDSGMKDRIFLCGMTTTPEQCYARASAVCHPSRHEGCPLVVLEGMAAGLPVIGFAQCPGVNSLVIDGKTGLLAPEMTPQSLSIALRKILSDVDLRHNMGNEALKQIQHYTKPAIYSKWENLLTLVSSKKYNTCIESLVGSNNNTSFQEKKYIPHLHTLQSILSQKNLLAGNNDIVKTFIFQFPWLTNILRPIHRLYKAYR
ncbi:MAG: glycosyltransferase [Desulfovibrionaceae bacterium]|nr:glycosyltransferase [Desulfovibrionaceae bacterium]